MALIMENVNYDNWRHWGDVLDDAQRLREKISELSARYSRMDTNVLGLMDAPVIRIDRRGR